MSLINKMLQELDRRHATQDANVSPDPEQSELMRRTRTVEARSFGSNAFWRAMAAVMVVVVAWVIWVMWQITPHSVVTALAYQALAQRDLQVAAIKSAAPHTAAPSSTAVPAGKATAPPTAPTLTAAPGHRVTPPTTAPAPAAAPVRKAAVPPIPAPVARSSARNEPRFDMLRLATQITTPIPKAAPQFKPRPRPAQKEPGAQERTSKPSVTRRSVSGRGTRVDKPERVASTDAARIDKRVDRSPRARAQAAFRRAMKQVNQGRMAEGMDSLRAALIADPSYDLARSTLIALLLESKRVDEATGLLQAGLAADPSNLRYAMLLGRIYVEHGEVKRALILLQRFKTRAAMNAEYCAFVAALYQRLGKHAQAIQQYQRALRLAGGVGAWWVGIGISEEALSRLKEASYAFERAKASGNLNAELRDFVDRRLRELR